MTGRPFRGRTEHAPGARQISINHPTCLLLLTSFIGRGKEQRGGHFPFQKELYGYSRRCRRNGENTAGYSSGASTGAMPIQMEFGLSPWTALSDPLRVPQTVASVFGIQEGHDRQVIETIIHVLREKTSLLILDNCEHLLEACTTLVRTLLTHCPNLRILTTSREILKVEGEATYYLSSLSTPKESGSS